MVRLALVQRPPQRLPPRRAGFLRIRFARLCNNSSKRYSSSSPTLKHPLRRIALLHTSRQPADSQLPPLVIPRNTARHAHMPDIFQRSA